MTVITRVDFNYNTDRRGPLAFRDGQNPLSLFKINYVLRCRDHIMYSRNSRRDVQRRIFSKHLHGIITFSWHDNICSRIRGAWKKKIITAVHIIRQYTPHRETPPRSYIVIGCKINKMSFSNSRIDAQTKGVNTKALNDYEKKHK